LESEMHRRVMNVLIDSVDQYFRGRSDYFAGGNMFIYYNKQQARNLDYRGPDFFFVWGRPRLPARKYWAIWEEDGHFPNVIVELTSSSTRHIDYCTKKDLYESTFRTGDYFCYDPLTFELFGWTLTPHGYVELEPNEEGWLWSEQLELWIGTTLCVVANTKNVFLRFRTPDGKLVETFEDAACDVAERARVEAEQAKVGAERAKVEAERAKVEVERERFRAETAEAELARLKAAFTAKDQPQS
jgi:Uma2 family endonuclease